MAQRVAITGLGTVTGFGVGMDKLWDGLCAGTSCCTPVTRFDASGFSSKLAAEVQGFSAKESLPKHYRKAVKVMARDIEMAVTAAKEAVDSAKLTTQATLPDDSTEARSYPSERMGCHIGAGLIAADADELTAALVKSCTPEGKFDARAWGTAAGGGGGMENLTPLWMLKYLPNMLACHVTILHDCQGPSNTITCAEASGLLSIGESFRVIERGDADLCFSGGAESKVNLMGLLRMEYAGRLAATGDETDGAQVTRPYDMASPGGLLGEGAGIVIMESLKTAMARAAPILAIIEGCGAGHSPRRVAGGPPDFADEGFEFAVLNAIEDARCTPDEIDAIVVLGCGVPTVDGGEAGAMRRVFGERLAKLPLITVGPAIGNLMAGIGGVLMAVGVKAIAQQRLPARINTGSPLAGLCAGPAPSEARSLRRVLVASSSMNGQNAAVVLGRPE